MWQLFRRRRRADYGDGVWHAGAESEAPAVPRGPRRGRVSLGGVITGLVVALSSCGLLLLWAGRFLQSRSFPLRRAVRGEDPWAGAGIAAVVVITLFLAYLWGGYTAGRMAAGAGLWNGMLVALSSLLAAGAVGFYLLAVRNIKRYDLPLGIGSMTVGANLSRPAIAGLVAAAAVVLGSGMWGGIMGARWHLKVAEQDTDHSSIEGDSFADLLERPTL